MEPAESSTRELTLEEAVSFAILLQKNEQLVEAHEVYRRVLATAPDHARALHYAGVRAHRAEPRAGARSSGLVQQPRHRPPIGRQARPRNRLVPACDRNRSGPCECL